MGKSLADIRKVTATDPPRVVIYGPPKLGKTSLAAEFPAPIFIQTEDGTSSGVEFDSFGRVYSYDEVLDAIQSLEGDGHNYQTLVIDSLSALEPMLWDKLCQVRGWPSIETPTFKAGYVEADKYWRELFAGLNYLRNDRGMGIVLIAHSEVVKTPNPTGADFPSWDLSMHKRARAIVNQQVDCILSLNFDHATAEEKGTKKAKASGGSNRWICAEGNPAMNAGNRYKIPARTLYRQGEGYAQLAPYFPPQRNHNAAQTAGEPIHG